MSAKQMGLDLVELKTVKLWVEEEMNELLSGTTDAARIDALYDAMGLLAMALGTYRAEDIVDGYNEYVRSQVARNRPEMPHRLALRAVAERMATARVCRLCSTAPAVGEVLASKRAQRGWQP